MFCPYHGDSKRSASLNVEKMVWNCKGCNEAGTIRSLVADSENWVLEAPTAKRLHDKAAGKDELPSEGQVAGWASALLAEKGCLAEFIHRRGLTVDTVKKFEIGWDQAHNCFTIPVRDLDGNLVNVRSYQLDPQDDRRKIWSVAGHGSPVLYPIDQLSAQALFVCEGELDALMLIQNGIPAITRTGAADVWNTSWSTLFKGKRVFVCHDMDHKGQHANAVIIAALRKHVSSVAPILLPYEVTEKHGKDVTDFFKDGHSKAEMMELVRQATVVRGSRRNEVSPEDQEEPVEVDVGVMDSFDAALMRRKVAMNVTITGKRIPSYLLPAEVQFSCNIDFKEEVCDGCPVKNGGAHESKSADSQKAVHLVYKIEPSDEVILKMVDSDEKKVTEGLWQAAGLPKCNKWEADVIKHRTVEEIYVRPSIESRTSGEPDFTHRRVISVGSHDLVANQTVRLSGEIRPNPNNQVNEFQAWTVERPPSTLDSYEVTPETRERLAVFQPSTGQSALAKVYEIADELANTVTMILGRPELHVFMDLVLHSALEFNFGTDGKQRGWLDGLIVGNTRTGKSKVAQELRDLYGMGEMVSCESASFAGVVGGLDRMGDSKWVVKWGSIPVNDRRAVILDEVSGLQPEQIAQMSSIRSSGVAELTKIQTERANARTRLLWMANPRNDAAFTYGVQVLAPLIGNPEDIARFDMVMGVFSEEVSSEEINKERKPREPIIDREVYRELLLWSWTRKVSDIKWAPSAVSTAREMAIEMGKHFVDQPPLVQSANVRLKLARIATAIALRTFSSDVTGKHCLVHSEHVQSAARFLAKIYNNPRFGYGSMSRQAIKDKEETRMNLDEILAYIGSVGVTTTGRRAKSLGPNTFERFIRDNPVFTRSQLEMAVNLTREQAQEIFSHLYELRAVHMLGAAGVKMDDLVLESIRSKYE